MNIINLTPHAVSFVSDGGEVITTIPASGTIARVSSTVEVTGDIAGIPTTRTVFGPVVDLPAPEEGVTLIVSSLVAVHPDCKCRDDVFIPAEPVRDAEGRIVGCRSLGRI